MKKETLSIYVKYALNSILGVCIFFFYGIIFNEHKAYMFLAICTTLFLSSYIVARKRPSKTKDISMSLMLTLIFIFHFFIFNKSTIIIGAILYVFMMPLSEFMGSLAGKQKLHFLYFPLLILFITFFVRPNLIQDYYGIETTKNKKVAEITYFKIDKKEVNM
ncbi:hypothetical protein U8527_19105 [Kordia algicida OT-1]|uniref:Uncharacterized protein n=1 Tax=Kordia algicida OT-1 TaxID=391587 RepID=A9DJJ7_9FLAO|nr:hypothetical protein [Kordia algicida]EDP98116.1 hypothetical protein KAOT1_12902 [Kordia algicida OT-1]